MSKRITDAALAHLKGLTNLTYLFIISTPVTDAGLVHLGGLTDLQLLVLSDCKQVTKRGIADLKKALPNTDISWP